MNKYLKKFSIMFVMTLILSLGFCISAFADDTDTAKTVKINNTALNFNKVIYVDSNNGDDINGNGEINLPFKSIKKGMDYLSNDSIARTNCAIVLKEGTYDITDCVKGTSNNLNSLYNGMKVSWIAQKGKEGKVFINSTNGFEVMEVENNNTYRIKISFYDLVFQNIKNDYVHLGGDDWTNEYYNCVFDNIGVGGYSGIVPNTNIIVKNCVFNNCRVSFNSGGYDISGKCVNTITTNTLIQPSNGINTSVLYNGNINSDYNILSDGWKNTGTGTNPDGTQANIGVYGGEFAWGIWNKANDSIILDKTSMNLNISDSQQITATTSPAGVQVTWRSNDTSIATVDSTGKVTGIKEGQVTITATTADGLTATCIVNVAAKTDTIEPTDPEESEYIINTAYAKGDNTNNASGQVSIIFKGVSEAQLKVVKTADVDSVYVGDNFTYTIEVTNTSDKTAKSVVINDSAPNHIDFIVNGITTTQGKVDPSSTSKNIIVNVGDIPPLGKVIIKIPVLVVE